MPQKQPDELKLFLSRFVRESMYKLASMTCFTSWPQSHGISLEAQMIFWSKLSKRFQISL